MSSYWRAARTALATGVFRSERAQTRLGAHRPPRPQTGKPVRADGGGRLTASVESASAFAVARALPFDQLHKLRLSRSPTTLAHQDRRIPSSRAGGQFALTCSANAPGGNRTRGLRFERPAELPLIGLVEPDWVRLCVPKQPYICVLGDIFRDTVFRVEPRSLIPAGRSATL